MAFHTFGRGGAPGGTLGVSIERFGDDYVATMSDQESTT